MGAEAGVAPDAALVRIIEQDGDMEPRNESLKRRLVHVGNDPNATKNDGGTGTATGAHWPHRIVVLGVWGKMEEWSRS